MSRFREISERDNHGCTLTYWPGEEPEDGADTLRLEPGEAFLKFAITPGEIHFEINQVARTDGRQESVLSWWLTGCTRQHLVVASSGSREPTATEEIDVLFIPAAENRAHLTAPATGFGVRRSLLRLFIDRTHLEIYRERLERGCCKGLQAIVRLPLLHQAEQAVYLVDDGADYDGRLESLHAMIPVPAGSSSDGVTGDDEDRAKDATAPGRKGGTGTSEPVGDLAEKLERVVLQQRVTLAALVAIGIILLF